MATKKKELSAQNLKAALWETLQLIQNGEIEPGQGDSIATQGREILRTVSVQLKIASQANRPVPPDVIDFSEK